MTQTITSSTPPAPLDAASGDKPKKKEDSFPVFLLKLVLVVAVFRSFVFSPFNIPSESMLPRLWNGDYLLAAKWPYGISRYSLPFSLPLLPEHRLFAHQPQRGDVVIFKAPPLNDTDYIKRVIGLPGDTIQLIDGVVYLNGLAIPKQKIADFIIPMSGNTQCYSPQYAWKTDAGQDVCRYPRFRETLPGGKTYDVLDFGVRPQDNFGPVVVPDGELFAMGDNRDNSEDSRFEAVPGGGVGMVPQDNLVGRASTMMFSTDGDASWIRPWTWFGHTRGSRIGKTI